MKRSLFNKTITATFLFCFVLMGITQMGIAQLLPLTFTQGRIAVSHDGNSYDKDDIFAVAMDYAVISAFGVQSKLVHYDACDNIESINTTTQQYRDQLASLNGHSQFPGLEDNSIFFDDQTQLDAAIAHFKAVAEAGSAKDILYFICAGPMEVPWRMINAVTPSYRKYINCISHSNWNDTKTGGNATHTWQSMKDSFSGDGTTFTHISDQNGSLGANDNNFSWMSSMPSGTCIPPATWAWVPTRNIKGDWDCSDAGMVWYLLTGDQNGNGAKLQERFLNPIYGGGTLYTLTTSATNGSISLNPSGGTYNAGTEVTLTATGDLGYAFNSWSGDLSGSLNPATIIMDGNKNITANFKATPTYKLITHAENGSITLNPIGGIYNGGAVVEVKAKANTGFVFINWSGDITGNVNPITITMDTNKSIAANFSVSTGGSDVTALTGWVSGNTNDKVSGSNRLMTVMVMGESTSNFSATGVTYGGQSMTKQTEKLYYVSGNRSYASIFTLNETGVNAASNGTIAVSWSPTPSVGSSIYSVLLDNVDQTTPVSAIANNGLSGTTVTTSALSAASGDMIIAAGATENDGSITFNNGFTEAFETNGLSWGDACGGYKMGSGVSETPSYTQSANMRLVICAIVAKKSVSSSVEFSTPEMPLPSETQLMQNYPNPFNSETTISYQLAEATQVKVAIYNSIGEFLTTLVDGYQSAGKYSVKWNATDDHGNKVVSGVYMYRLETGETVQMKKFILLQ